MLNLGKVLLALCAIVICNIKFGESNFQSDMEKINGALVSAVQTADLSDNLKALEQLYQKETKKLTVFNKSYLETLRQIISLRESKCDQNTYAILIKLNRAYEGESRRFYNSVDEPYRRISNILRQLSTQHARDCQSVYAQNLEAKVNKLDQEKVHHVETLADHLSKSAHEIDINEELSMVTLFKKFIKNGSNLNWYRAGGVVRAALVANVADNSDSKYLKYVIDEVKGTYAVNEQKFRQLYDNFLIKPCKYYVQELGDEIYTPAHYDSVLYHNVDESKRDFYQYWARFTICTELLDGEDLMFKKLLKSV